MLARLMRLGFVANFISTPVLTGFKAGIGLVIVLDQVPKLLGIHIAKHGFFADLFAVAQHIPQTSLATLAVAGRDAARADRHGTAVAAFAGAVGRGRGRHRRGMAARAAGFRRVDGGADSARHAIAHAARPRACASSCCPERSGSRS